MAEAAYYVLICRECWPEWDDPDPEVRRRAAPMPFPSASERGHWASEHTRGTGHDKWFVADQAEDGTVVG